VIVQIVRNALDQISYVKYDTLFIEGTSVSTANHTAFAALSRRLPPPPLPSPPLLSLDQRERVAGAWRMASQDIADDIRFIRQYLKVIAEKDERLSTGALVHSRAYVEACAGWLPQTVARYLRHLRQITECELAMAAAGIRFALSSYAWEA